MPSVCDAVARVTRQAKFIAAVCLLLLAGSSLARAAKLLSPWDLHPAHASTQAYACPNTAELPRNIVAFDYYSDSKHSIPDPERLRAYKQASAPFSDAMSEGEKAADAFQKSGSAPAAACVLRILDRAAAHGAMTGTLSSNQAYYLQNWTLGALAVTYLKVRQSGAGSEEERARIEKWMAEVARSTRGYFDARRAKQTKDGRNNHLYWAGFAVMAAGIAADDRALYEWGVGTYLDGVGQIAADGTLPLEMARGGKALHYHLFAAAPLVTMAEFAAANGQDLYGAAGGALHRLVERCVAGLKDNSGFAKQAGAAQDTPGARLTASDVAWLRPYAARFPEPAIARLLEQAPSLHYGYLGGNVP